MRKAFSIKTKTSELLERTKELPCVLVENIVYAKAIKLMDDVEHKDLLSFEITE